MDGWPGGKAGGGGGGGGKRDFQVGEKREKSKKRQEAGANKNRAGTG